MLKHGHLGTLPVHLQYHLSSIVPKCFIIDFSNVYVSIISMVQ